MTAYILKCNYYFNILTVQCSGRSNSSGKAVKMCKVCYFTHGTLCARPLTSVRVDDRFRWQWRESRTRIAMTWCWHVGKQKMEEAKQSVYRPMMVNVLGRIFFSQLSEMLGFSSSFFSTVLLRGLIRTFCNCDGDEPNCWWMIPKE